MSKLTNLHKFWESYQINNCSKTLYIKTRLRQIEVSSFPNIDSSKIGTLIFQRKTNLVIGEYLAGPPRSPFDRVLPFRSSKWVFVSLKPRTFSLLILCNITIIFAHNVHFLCEFGKPHFYIFLVGAVHYSQYLQVLFSGKTTLKLGLTVPFTHLKIILL